MSPLRQRMIEDMQVRNLAAATQSTYLEHVYRFARHFHRSPEDLGPEEIRTYQLYLINERGLAPQSALIAVSALRFVYTVSLKRDWNIEEVIPAPKKPDRLPMILSQEEVVQFLGCVHHIRHHAILTTCYAAGLRISEVLRLKPIHIDNQRMLIHVEQGKGQKDRFVMLSPKLLDTLRQYWRVRFSGSLKGARPASACAKAQSSMPVRQRAALRG
jgi:integrase/recombinase XerD